MKYEIGQDDIWVGWYEGKQLVNEELALAVLLANDVVIANERRYTGFYGDTGQSVVLFVICNDLFAWGTADGEDLPHDEIGNLFKAWEADPKWGSDKWCCKRRNMQPQAPIKRDMKRDGSWDDEMEALPPNPYEVAS